MIKDIQNAARAITLKNVILGIVSLPFVLLGFIAGLLVVLVKWIIASIKFGYDRAQRILTNVATG